jgi:hypothetical protein
MTIAPAIVTHEPRTATAAFAARPQEVAPDVFMHAQFSNTYAVKTPVGWPPKRKEAGCELVVLVTRKERSSQTCPCCGAVRKKALSERQHRCGCGFVATRDQASALAMLGAGLRLAGREPA